MGKRLDYGGCFSELTDTISLRGASVFLIHAAQNANRVVLPHFDAFDISFPILFRVHL